jgi:hypothetical protein
MALFGGARDISLFRGLNRELIWDFISQQCVYYKFKLEETKVNMYGEASGAKFYYEPVIFNTLISLGEQNQPASDMGIDFNWNIEFRFFRDDLVDANLVPQVGDIIMWYEGYWEIDNVNDNQFFVGKDPDYPYEPNPLNPGLENFGTNLSLICLAHYVPADKVQITRERL